MLDLFLKEFKIGEAVAPEQYSPLTLAYIGDCVYELYVRTYLIKDHNLPVKQLHRRATEYVKASAQSDLYQKIAEKLTEEETAVYKRGRNTDSRPPKNAVLRDYKSATGIEALIGWLYLRGDGERIYELLSELTAEPRS